jgi:hypothetical protein
MLRQNDPLYWELRNKRLQDFTDNFRNLPNVSEMSNLLKESQKFRDTELENFLNRFKNQDIDLYFNKQWFRDEHKFRELTDALRISQELNDQITRSQNLLFQNETQFYQPIPDKIPAKNEFSSAEIFILELQVKLNEQEQKLEDGYQLVLYASFNNITMQVDSCRADTQNQVEFSGSMGGNEMIAFVRTSQINYFFLKVPVENQKKKNQIGFIIDREIEENEDTDSGLEDE